MEIVNSIGFLLILRYLKGRIEFSLQSKLHKHHKEYIYFQRIIQLKSQ